MKKKLKEWSTKGWFWIVIAILVLIIIGCIFCLVKPKGKKVVTFLSGTDSDEVMSIISEATGIDDTEGSVIADSLVYTKLNDKYIIRVEANKDTKEIVQVSINSLTHEDPTDVFLALDKIDYPGKDSAKFTEWVTNNIGKNSKITIGEAMFELSMTTNDLPIIFMETEGAKEYSRQQSEKPPVPLD